MGRQLLLVSAIQEPLPATYPLGGTGKSKFVCVANDPERAVWFDMLARGNGRQKVILAASQTCRAP